MQQGSVGDLSLGERLSNFRSRYKSFLPSCQNFKNTDPDLEHIDFWGKPWDWLPSLDVFLKFSSKERIPRIFNRLHIGQLVEGFIEDNLWDVTLSALIFEIFPICACGISNCSEKTGFSSSRRPCRVNDLEGLNIKIFICNDLSEVRANFSVHKKFLEQSEPGDLFRGSIIYYELERLEIWVTNFDSRSVLPLGFFTHCLDYNVCYRDFERYQETLTRSHDYHNSLYCSELLSTLQVCREKDTFLLESKKEYLKEDSFEELRKRQNMDYANECVKSGVERFKSDDAKAALGYYLKALEIEPEHADALVARGALHASQFDFKAAEKDFKAALHLDESHTNAKRYLARVYEVQASRQEDRGDLRAAVDLLLKSRALCPQNASTSQKLERLEGILLEKVRKRGQEHASSLKEKLLRLVNDPGSIHKSVLHRKAKRRKKSKKKFYEKRKKRRQSSSSSPFST
ncbi:tetratricopeptide repeat protein 14-like isoform X2 [Zophobas morio]|uniref:tetratricopeptide repeat protein 14-like isoform X2 n=1 Tax=Zophobas morio TaxID=2755281 RepID=UPI003083775D